MSFQPGGRILVATDFSLGARAAVDYAALLAPRLRAGVDLLFVWDPPVFVPEQMMVVVPNAAGRGLTIEDLARNRATVELKEAESVLHHAGVERVRTHIAVGQPAREILALAARESFELIMMGTHGRTGLAHALVGSVAEKVVRHATCPVLTVRRREKA